MNKLFPKSYKFKKLRKRIRTNKLKDFRTSYLRTKGFGLKIINNAIISSSALEAARRAITRRLKKTGNLKINGFPFVSITAKSLGVRMGKGVGSISHWVFPVKKGRILFELKNVSFDLAKSALKSAAFKLPAKCKFVYKTI